MPANVFRSAAMFVEGCCPSCWPSVIIIWVCWMACTTASAALMYCMICSAFISSVVTSDEQLTQYVAVCALASRTDSARKASNAKRYLRISRRLLRGGNESFIQVGPLFEPPQPKPHRRPAVAFARDQAIHQSAVPVVRGREKRERHALQFERDHALAIRRSHIVIAL